MLFFFFFERRIRRLKRNFNISQRKVGVILQYGQMGLSTLISLFYTPVMLRILGQGEYGIYNLAASIISYLSLLSLGLGASYVRFYSRYKVHQDDNGIKILNGTYFLTFWYIHNSSHCFLLLLRLCCL